MKRCRTGVTDHAIVRYLERVQGFDIERLRAEIGRRVEAAATVGASAVVIDGFAYAIRLDAEGRPVVTTVQKHSNPDYVLPPRERKVRARSRGWSGAEPR
jgi:hypothetical protein